MISKLVFLGGGNMAEAIAAGLYQNDKFKIEIIQRNPEKASKLKGRYPQMTIQPLLNYKLEENDILVLAIKPQQAKEACQQIKEFSKKCMVVSVMAGIPLKTISQWLNNKRVARAMPNTPGLIGKGITALYFNSEFKQQDQKIIEDMFSAIGIVHLAIEEYEIDKIVPISSSAVAFIYYFMEGIIKSAVNEFGFNEKEATLLVKQMVSGSVALLDLNPDISISDQRSLVTSKKGLTEQGILTFENQKLHDIIKLAMQNCYNRGLEMAAEFK